MVFVCIKHPSYKSIVCHKHRSITLQHAVVSEKHSCLEGGISLVFRKGFGIIDGRNINKNNTSFSKENHIYLGCEDVRQGLEHQETWLIS